MAVRNMLVNSVLAFLLIIIYRLRGGHGFERVGASHVYPLIGGIYTCYTPVQALC